MKVKDNYQAEFWTKKLNKLIQPSKKVKIYYNPNNPANRTLHILTIVDNNYIVCKHWLKNKKRWNYVVEHIYFFWLHFESKKVKVNIEDFKGGD